MSTARTAAAALCLCLFAAAGWIASDLVERDRVLSASGGDPRVLARILAGDRRLPRPGCAVPAHGADAGLDQLMEAIGLMESHVSGRAVRFFEELVVRTAIGVGLQPPDLSIGNGQIRISSAIRAIERGLPHDTRVDGRHVARRLLDPCQNHLLGIEILKRIGEDRQLSIEASLSRATVLTLAADYNGQGSARGIRDALSKAMYREAVLHAYHELSFRRLHKAATGSAPRSPQQ